MKRKLQGSRVACSYSRLVAQPPAVEELYVHPHDGPQLLQAHPGADLRVTAPDERVKGELRHVGHVVTDYQDLVQLLHLQLLGRLGDLAMLDDAPQRRLVPLVPVGLFSLCVHLQVLLDALLDGDPAVVYVDRRAEDVNSLEDALIEPRSCPIWKARGRCRRTQSGAPRGPRIAGWCIEA